MKKKWFRLDNAAKIYPAAASRTWSSVFRLSAETDAEADAPVLQKALDDVISRFPTVNLRIKTGFFWMYLEEVQHPVTVREDSGHPCLRFHPGEDHGHLLRVSVYRNRINVEMSHCLTDGAGALVFMKTLLARYFELKGEKVLYDHGALSLCDAPTAEEAEDTFLKMPLPPVRGKRTLGTAFHYPGKKDAPHTLRLISARLDPEQLRAKAKEAGVSINDYLTAVFIYCGCRYQEEHIPNRKRMLPVRIQVPVNLRSLYPSRTLRNFSYFVSPEADPRLGKYTFEEILKKTNAYIRYYSDPKMLFACVSGNVRDEKNLLLRLTPFPLKRAIISLVYRVMGDRTETADFSNLGRVELPTGVQEHVTEMEAVMGASLTPYCDAALITCSGVARLTFTRNMKEADMAREVLSFLAEKGISVTVRSNREDE